MMRILNRKDILSRLNGWEGMLEIEIEDREEEVTLTRKDVQSIINILGDAFDYIEGSHNPADGADGL